MPHRRPHPQLHRRRMPHRRPLHLILHPRTPNPLRNTNLRHLRSNTRHPRNVNG